MVGAIVAAHLAVVWALLQVREVRDAVADVAPMFVSLIAPTTPPEPSCRRHRRRRRRSVVRRPVPMMPLASPPQPTPAPAPFVVPAPPSSRRHPAPVDVASLSRRSRRRQSRRAGAEDHPGVGGAVPRADRARLPAPVDASSARPARVMLRVYIDEAGRPARSQVDVAHRAHVRRLDDAALAAVRKARFKPPTENGQPVAGWAYVPVDFELEK